MARNKFDIDEELETAFSAAHLKRILVYVKPYQNLFISRSLSSY